MHNKHRFSFNFSFDAEKLIHQKYVQKFNNNFLLFLFKQCLALFIGSLCHDLDHRGKNNKFMLDTESPLAAIYSTSTMEHHHFNQTVTILQQVCLLNFFFIYLLFLISFLFPIIYHVNRKDTTFSVN